MSEPRATTYGKQVLLDGEHFADATDTAAALLIATGLNERAAVVAWLRERDHVCADLLAEQIEKGRHVGR